MWILPNMLLYSCDRQYPRIQLLFYLHFQTVMYLVSPAMGPMLAPAPAAKGVRGWRATAIVRPQTTSACLASTQTRTGNAIRVTITATGVQVLEKPTA